MAARKFTGEEMLIALRNIGMVPGTGSTGSEDADLLKVINEAMIVYLLPRVLKCREDFFIQRERVALSTTARYRLPHRASYQKLKDLWYSDSNGDRFALDPIPADFRHQYSNTGETAPEGYFLEGNYVVLVPEDSTSYSGYLEFVYFARPGDLVLSTSVGVVSSVSSKTITCSADVSSIFSVGDIVDVHSPNSGAELKCWDLTVNTVSGTDVTVDEDIDGSTFGTYAVAAGDYLTLAEETALPAVPREFHPLLARAGALSFSESIGDVNGVEIHGKLLEGQLRQIIGAIESRVESDPLKLGRVGWM